MAAYEGFLTSVYAGKDIFRPTFFELIAQEQLNEVFRPAVRFIVDIWRERTTFFRVILDSWESIYSLLLLLLEGYHLRVHGATFAEHFFGLRRQETASARLLPLEAFERARERSQAPPLTRRQQWTSLFVVVVLPWLSKKCKDRFRQVEASTQPRSSRELLFYRLYPAVHALESLVSLTYRLLYLFEQTDIWSPWLQALNLKLARHFPDPPSEDSSMRIQDVFKICGQAALWGTVYVLQFLQWWYQREHLLQPTRPKKAPPPPAMRFPYPEGRLEGARFRLVVLPEDPRICALCHRIRQNPAMSCAGYAFCYTCLVPHVQEFGHCPVSGEQMLGEDIRRIRDEG